MKKRMRESGGRGWDGDLEEKEMDKHAISNGEGGGGGEKKIHQKVHPHNFSTIINA